MIVNSWFFLYNLQVYLIKITNNENLTKRKLRNKRKAQPDEIQLGLKNEKPVRLL